MMRFMPPELEFRQMMKKTPAIRLKAKPGTTHFMEVQGAIAYLAGLAVILLKAMTGRTRLKAASAMIHFLVVPAQIV